MRYYIETHGCQMNVHDSEKIAGILEKRGYVASNDKKNADVIVFNTCAIRENAEKKVVGQIGDYKPLKKLNKNLIICVGGCMTQQKGYTDMLSKRFPFVDIFFGTQNQSDFARLFDSFIKTKSKQIEINDKPINCEETFSRTSGTNAWINIMHGCNNFCTYCIVPYVRGREISRPMQEIIDEAKALIEKGYPQITLLGQNVNSYGNDTADRSQTFANLLYKLNEIEGKFRIRFMTSHPKDLSEDVIMAIKNCNKVCHGIHLPFQSGSNTILKAMNRKYTRESYLALIEKVTSILPDADFSSDCIVGFPGETEEDFLQTMSLVERVKFQSLFMFIYSKRKGTVAESMPNQVDDQTKKDRIARLIKLQNKIVTQKAKQQIGKTFEVLIENIDKKTNMLTSSTDTGKAVSLIGDKKLIGTFAKVKIIDTKNSKLIGQII